MSLKKWFARKGAVGGTARWAAKGYLLSKKRDPGLPFNIVLETLVVTRYQHPRHQSIKDSLIRLIREGQCRGLAHLVTGILGIEAGYQENTAENRYLFMDIIKEELSKYGIPEEHIYDSSHLQI